MAIYYLILLLMIVSGALISPMESKRKKVVYLVVCFSILFVFMAIRGLRVGSDIQIYDAKFSQIARTDGWQNYIEIVKNAPVYCLLNKLISFVGGYRLFLVVAAAIILFAVAFYIYDFSDNAVISVYCFVALFFYLHAYNITRQFLAVALVLLALCAKKRKNSILCLVCSALAIGVHSTAILAMPLLCLSTAQTGVCKVTYWSALSICCLLLLTLKKMLTWGVELFCLVFPRYQYYLLNTSLFSVYDQSSGANIYLSLFYFAIAVLAVLIALNVFPGIQIPEEKAGVFRFLTIAVAVGAAVGIVGGSYKAIARILYFYQIHAICLIPNIIEHTKSKVTCYYLLVCVLLIPFTICLLRNFGEVVPYLTFWN